MKVKAVIKKIKTHFKKQGIDIDVEYNGTRWSFQHKDYVGSFRDNATQMIESLLPKPPKFKVGQLVKGKSNKRAIRQGYAGKVGLVMAEGGCGFARIAWIGDNAHSKRFGWPTFPERDLELAS